MRIVSEVYGKLGDALLGVGQAILIAAVVAKFFTKEPISWWIVIGGVLFSLVPAAGALILVQKAHRLKKEETNRD